MTFILTLMSLCTSATSRAMEAGSVDFMAIHEQARFANAAYQAENGIRVFLESIDYKLTLYRTVANTQISYFLATNAQTRTQVVSVRGTTNIENAMVDILLKLRPDKTAGIQLHEGFGFAARQVYTELKPLLKADYRIRTTGHSLGGAVALILAIYIDADRFNIDQVITFGQPKVTNIAGANKISDLNVIRVVTPLDIVPLVPPLDPLDINNLDVYWHTGKEVILLAGNHYAVVEGLESMLRATRFTQQPFNQENIGNHKMSFYLDMIDLKKKSSRLVPYENDLNLFNLFGSE